MIFTSSNLHLLPESPGIYQFLGERKKILYVGKAKNLKKRIASYFIDKIKDYKTKALVDNIKYIEIIPVRSEFEALLLEAKLINSHQPKYNVIWRDDKHYLYIKITSEEFPRILFARKETAGDSYFGPFPQASIVKDLLRYLRTIFPYCTQKPNTKKRCFYTHLSLCNPCPFDIQQTTGEKYQLLKREYKKNIHNIKNILEGKIGSVRVNLFKRMKNLAEEKRFEEAADFRDKIISLDYLVNQYSPSESYLEDPRHLEKIHEKEQKELLMYLKPYFPGLTKVKHIECYDISNISGKFATGSMVTFINNQPDKKRYRRFKIRFKERPDDLAMLKEIMTRRLRHTEWKLPNLFVIDGGQPQLKALMKVLRFQNMDMPMIGLAKSYEEIVVPHLGGFIRLRLGQNSAVLNLVKRIRDEAHRFAHNYHTLLRLKNLFSGIKDKRML